MIGKYIVFALKKRSIVIYCHKVPVSVQSFIYSSSTHPICGDVMCVHYARADLVDGCYTRDINIQYLHILFRYIYIVCRERFWFQTFTH